MVSGTKAKQKRSLSFISFKDRIRSEWKFHKSIIEAKEEDQSKKATGKKTITKTVVLPDGTYGTVTTVVDAKDLNKHKDNLKINNALYPIYFLKHNLYKILN